METIRPASPAPCSPQIFPHLSDSALHRKTVAQARTHCWYCNKPLNGYRRFCSKECEEAIYEDNEAARERRFIFGCRC